MAKNMEIGDCESSRSKEQLTCIANSLSICVGSTWFNLDTSSVISISENQEYEEVKMLDQKFVDFQFDQIEAEISDDLL